ncbi:MAG: DUF47 domain-containing protein [Bacteroidetes bacterium]|nr:MAG: DUF47 domain-containing protein [Bacteroidota bacterium]
MSLLFKTSDYISGKIDEFFNCVDEGSLIFKEGVSNYMKNDQKTFKENIDTIRILEGKADTYRRKIENELYLHSLLPEYRGDVLRLLEKTDDIIDTAKENLNQFDVETPKIPKEIHSDIIKLADVSALSIEAIISASRSFFTDVRSVKDKIHRVYFYEKQADKLANEIKRKVFKEILNLELSEKMHLRYFIFQIENLSDRAEVVADILAILSIKRTI